MAVDPEKDKTFGSLNTLVPTLDSMDERGLVLSLAAFAEEALGHLLKTYLLKNVSAEKLLDGFNAPFGTFSTRIKGCHALGLIEDTQANDLELLRKIRNEFAHSWSPIRLDDQRNRSLISDLSFPATKHDFPETAREKLVLSVSFLLTELRSTDSRIEESGLVARLFGGRLIAGSMELVGDQIAEFHERITALEKNYAGSKGHHRQYLDGQISYWTMRVPFVRKDAAGEEAEMLDAFAARLRAIPG